MSRLSIFCLLHLQLQQLGAAFQRVLQQAGQLQLHLAVAQLALQADLLRRRQAQHQLQPQDGGFQQVLHAQHVGLGGAEGQLGPQQVVLGGHAQIEAVLDVVEVVLGQGKGFLVGLEQLLHDLDVVEGLAHVQDGVGPRVLFPLLGQAQVQLGVLVIEEDLAAGEHGLDDLKGE